MKFYHPYCILRSLLSVKIYILSRLEWEICSKMSLLSWKFIIFTIYHLTSTIFYFKVKLKPLENTAPNSLVTFFLSKNLYAVCSFRNHCSLNTWILHQCLSSTGAEVALISYDLNLFWRKVRNESVV